MHFGEAGSDTSDILVLFIDIEWRGEMMSADQQCKATAVTQSNQP